MRHQCPGCNLCDFAVAKTWPHESYTIRQLKCQHCGANVFSHEYIMEKEEYKWFREGTKCWPDLR